MYTTLNRPTCVIVGMEANGLGVARALALHRITSIGLAGPHSAPPTKTNTCHIVHSRSWTERDVIAELKSIAQRLDHKAPLLITKDEAVLWISENRNELSEAYDIYLPDHNVVTLLMNKTKFLEIAVREGWPVPTFWTINSKDDLMCKLSEVTYPCILKPQLKNAEFRKSSPQKAFRITTPNQLVRVYDMVAQWEKEVVIQEWIEGKDERIAFCLTYYDRNGKPLALFSGRKRRQWPIAYGNTVMSEPVPKEWEVPIRRLTERIWKCIGFKGIGSIEYKIRENTHDLIIMEPTIGRTDYQNETAVINGYNIPAIAYCDLTGITPPPVCPSSRPVKLIDGVAEIKSALVLYRAGELTIGQWIKERRGRKKYMILRANDVGPFIKCVCTAGRRALSRCVVAILGENTRKKLATALRLVRHVECISACEEEVGTSRVEGGGKD